MSLRGHIVYLRITFRIGKELLQLIFQRRKIKNCEKLPLKIVNCVISSN